MTGSLQQWLVELGYAEGSNSYQTVSGSGTYLGVYQLGPVALQSAGWKNADGTWTALANSWGVTSQKSFLSNPAAQNAAAIDLLKYNEDYASRTGMDSYIGQTIDGIYITPSGLQAAEWLVGPAETKNWLQSGGTIVAEDENYTTIQSRLIGFSDYILPNTSSYVDQSTGFLVEPGFGNTPATYWDPSTGQTLTAVSGSNGATAYVEANSSILSSNGATGFALDQNTGLLVFPSVTPGGPVSFIDPISGQAVVPITTTEGYTVYLSPDSQELLNIDNALQNNNTLIQSISPDNSGKINFLLDSPDGSSDRSLTLGSDGTLGLIDGGTTFSGAPGSATLTSDSATDLTLGWTVNGTPVSVEGMSTNEMLLTIGTQGPIAVSGATYLQYADDEVDATYGTGQGNAVLLNAVYSVDGPGTVSTTVDGQTTEKSYATAAQEYGSVGAAFGSSLGRILAPNNAFAQIGTSTALGALGQQVAAALGVAGNGADLTTTLGTIINGDGGLMAAVGSQGLGAVSAFLMGDLFNAIGFTGAPAQIVESLSSQAVAQIATNLLRLGDPVVVNGQPAFNPDGSNETYDWDTGIDLGTELANVAGGFLGTELGNLAYSASTVQGSEGASVGSAVGGAIGALPFATDAVSEAVGGVVDDILGDAIGDAILPGIGVLLGAFAGDIIGGLVGDLFGQPHVAHIGGENITPVVSSGGALTFSPSPWTSYQQGPDETSLGDAVSGSLNAVLGLAGGTVTNAASLTPFGIGVNDETGTDAQLLYYYDDYGVNPYNRTQYYASSTPLSQVL